MVRFGPLALASALLATPVLGIEGTKHLAASETVASPGEVGRDAPPLRTTSRDEAVAPACRRKVRIVYSGMTTQPDTCETAR